MAKILDKMFNRVIEGDLLEISQSDLENSGLGKLIPSAQANISVVANSLTNINGRTLSAYESTLTEDEYTYYTITKNSEVLTEEQAKDYMEYMTGSRFLPVYNYEKPQNSIFLFAEGTIWKPQFDSTNGLRLYKLGDTGGSQLYLHTFTWKMKHQITEQVEECPYKVKVITPFSSNILSLNLTDFDNGLKIFTAGLDDNNDAFIEKKSDIITIGNVADYISMAVQLPTDYDFYEFNPEQIAPL